MSSAQHCKEISNPSRFLFFLTKDMVILSPFIIVGMFRIDIPTEKVTVKLQHMIGITSLFRVTCQLFIYAVGMYKLLLMTVTSCTISLMVYYRIPEEVGNVFRTFARMQFIIAGFTYHFGYKSIGMFEIKIIFMFCQRVYNSCMLKKFS